MVDATFFSNEFCVSKLGISWFSCSCISWFGPRAFWNDYRMGFNGMGHSLLACCLFRRIGCVALLARRITETMELVVL